MFVQHKPMNYLIKSCVSWGFFFLNINLNFQFSRNVFVESILQFQQIHIIFILFTYVCKDTINMTSNTE